MASIWLTRRECSDEGNLPPVCVRCGAAADQVKRQTFSWYSLALNLLIIPGLMAGVVAGLVIWLVVILAMTKRMRAVIPVCHEHWNHWRRRTLLVNGLAGFGFIAMVGGMIGAIARAGNRGQSDPQVISSFGGIGAFLVLVVPAALIHRGTIRAAEITTDELQLVGVSKTFAETVKDEREARREARRARKRRDEDDE